MFVLTIFILLSIFMCGTIGLYILNEYFRNKKDKK